MTSVGPPAGAAPATTDPQAARPRLEGAAQLQASEIRVFLVADPTGGWQFERLKMTETLGDRFATALANEAAAHTQDQLVRYNPGRTIVGGEAAVVPIADVTDLAALVASLEGEVGGVDHFALDSDVARGLKLYIVSARLTDGSWVHGLRTKTVRSLRPTRSRRIAALWTGELYDDLVEDPLVFDETFDALVVGDLVVVLNQRNFERGSGFLEAARNEAEGVLRAATAHLPIANLDELVTATRSDVNMLAKMRGIAARLASNPTYAARLTMPNVVAFLQTNPDIDLDLTGPPGAEQLVFHPEPARRWRILKLLDDDFLHSQLTDLNYEANSKDLR